MEGSINCKFEEFSAALWERDAEINSIQEALQSRYGREGVVHYFYGISGVGKSKLCDYTRRYVQAQLQVPHAMAYISMHDDLTEIQIIQRLYRELSTQAKLSFPRYEAALGYLFAVDNDPSYRISSAPDAPSILVSAASSAAKIGVNALGLDSTPLNEIINILAKGIIERCLSAIRAEVDERIRKEVTEMKRSELEQFREELASRSPNEVRQGLGRYFMEDLKSSLETFNTICAKLNEEPCCLVVLIDAFEKRRHTPSLERFFQQLFEKTGKTTWFLFGTEERIPQHSSHSVVLQSYLVKPFEEERLGEYLEKQGISSKEVQNNIIAYSNGLPAAVQILIDIYRDNGGHLGEYVEEQSYETLFEQYFIHHLSEDERKLFFRLALFDSWDRETFSYVLPSCDFRQETFDRIVSKTALVAPSPSCAGGNDRYCLVDIVRKALLVQLEADTDGARMDAYHIKYLYEQALADQYLGRLKSELVIDQELNEQLRVHCSAAFRAGLKSYSGQQEFEAVSAWCTKTQQALSKPGLFLLKEELTKLYLDLVEKRDDFRYDTEDDKNKRFRFQNMRDRIWALRFCAPDVDEKIDNTSLAGQYYAQLLSKFGVHCPHIPFATYLWGLTFYDIGDYDTASWLLEQSICADSAARGYDSAELNSSIYTVVHNVLGCVKMDLGQFSQAENEFLETQKTRPAKDTSGWKKTYHNFSKLYFRWAQAMARENPHAKDVSSCLELAQEYLNKYIELLERDRVHSAAEQCTAVTCRIMLAAARRRLSEEANAHDWRQYADQLENALSELKRSKGGVAKLMLSVQHNITLMYALQGSLDRAKREISDQISTARKIYRIDSDRVSNHNKPVIQDFHANLKTVENYICDTKRPIDPHEFLFQF